MRFWGFLNLSLLLMICVVAALFLCTSKEEFVPSVSRVSEKSGLPKSSFAVAEEFFHNIGEKLFVLKWAPPQMQLPDLREELLFYGKNSRPDYAAGKARVHLALKGSDTKTTIQEHQRLYLIYQGEYTPAILNRSGYQNSSEGPIWGDVSARKQSEGAYTFSPDNQPTPLWLELGRSNEHSIDVSVHMLDEKGMLICSPSHLNRFSLQKQEFAKTELVGWELGGLRVDTTLLVRQKAKWIGPDLFLELHGGEEYSHVAGCERIDFLDDQTPYSCFVKQGDFLVWKENRWAAAYDQSNTQNLPLMVVKKIDEKIMSFELWDSEGRGKTVLNLIRAKDQKGIPNVPHDFKFVGAKTWAQFTVECRNGGRMTLKPNDWLVLTPDGWKKIETPDQIDAYVDMSLTGPLFVLDEMTKQGGRQVLCGHLFNASRSEVTTVELTASQTPSLANFTSRIPTTPPIKPQLTELEGGGE